jgi:hypothetical protein
MEKKQALTEFYSVVSAIVKFIEHTDSDGLAVVQDALAPKDASPNPERNVLHENRK